MNVVRRHIALAASAAQIALLLATPFSVLAQRVPAGQQPITSPRLAEPESVPGELVVQMKRPFLGFGNVRSRAQKAAKDNGATLSDDIEKIRTYVLKVDPEKKEEVRANLARNSNVARVTP